MSDSNGSVSGIGFVGDGNEYEYTLSSSVYTKDEVDKLIKEHEAKMLRVMRASKWKSRVKRNTRRR